MPIAIWGPRFETGDKAIDDQQKELFAVVNKLADSFTKGQGKSEAKNTLGFLLRHAVEHFQKEESFMKGYDYPDLVPHVAEHSKLLLEVRDIWARVEHGQELTMEIAVFLAEWLHNHIEGEDLAFAAWLKAGRPEGVQFRRRGTDLPGNRTRGN